MLDSHGSHDGQGRLPDLLYLPTHTLPDPDSSEPEELMSSAVYQKQLHASTNLAQVDLKDDSHGDDDRNSCLDSFGDDSHDDEEEKQANADNL